VSDMNNIDPVNLDPVPSDLPEDTKYLGDRLDKLIGVMTDIRQATVNQPSPSDGAYFLMTGRNDFPQTTRLRASTLVVSVSAAATIAVLIGSATFMSFDVGAAELTKIVPLPIVIDAGKDVTVTTSAGAIRTAFLLGKPESDRP
jgi:hypothetical protein